MRHNKQIFFLASFCLCFFLFDCSKTISKEKANNKEESKNVQVFITEESQNENRTEHIPSGLEDLPQEKEIKLIKEIDFISLEENEGLKFSITVADDKNDPDTFIIYTNTGRELFRLQEKSFYHIEEYIKYLWQENDLPKAIFFGYIVLPYASSGLRHGVCFVDGKNGKAKLFLIGCADYVEVDDSVKYICIVDTGNVPIITIYNLETLEKLDRVLYEPYRNRGMYPIIMEYKDGAFIVTLSADTVEFATLEIPINGNNTYQVVDSFSFDS